MPETTINIIGAGSVGQLWAAYLLKKNINAYLYGRSPVSKLTYQLNAPNYSFEYETSIFPIETLRPSDFTIICVKAYALKSLCQQLALLKNPPKVIVLMMNGMGLLEIINHWLPNTKAYHATTTHGANLVDRSLNHTGSGVTLIGDTNEKAISSNVYVEQLIILLNEALPITTWNHNHQQSLWKKLIINSIINPLSSIYQVKNGDIVKNEQIKAQAKILAQELSPLINRYLPNDNWQSLFNDVLAISVQTSDNTSSMLQDIKSNRRTEIEFITGYLISKAETLDISLNTHCQVYEKVLASSRQSH